MKTCILFLHNIKDMENFFPIKVGWLVVVLKSHSAIFQIYSDGTVVKFPNFDLLPGIQCHGQLGPTPTQAPGRPMKSLTSLKTEGPQAVRVYRELNLDLPIHNPACYLYATVAAPTKVSQV